MFNPKSKEVKLGEDAQRIADQILKKNGYYILDAHLSTKNGAALFKGDRTSIIAMDNVDIKNGKTIFRDTKGKTSSSFHYAYPSGEEHGIDIENFNHYCTQCKEGNIDGRIAVVELKRETSRGKFITSNKLLIYPLSAFNRKVLRTEMKNPYGKKGMIYCDRNAFLEIYDLGDNDWCENICCLTEFMSKFCEVRVSCPRFKRN